MTTLSMFRVARWKALTAAAGLMMSLVGCAVGPAYQRPTAFAGTNAVPGHFSGSDASTNAAIWKTAAPAADLSKGAWWDIFRDPELSRLERLAELGNQDLAEAGARIAQARALIHVARAEWLPEVTLNPQYTRQRTSKFQPQDGHAAGVSRTYGTWTLPLEASWELDLWGRVSQRVTAARARFEAVSDDGQAVALAVQAEVATEYMTLRAAEAEFELLQRTADAYRRSLDLTRNRRAGGIATDLDVAQAEAQLKETEAQIPAVELQAVRLRHALATLCGQPATTFVITTSPVAGEAVPVVPSSLPSELLERRPDIAAAERRMAAANAEIGVAQSAFYPSVRLTGVAGLQSVSASSLFDWPARLWAVGPVLDLPIFTGGRNRAQLAATRAAYDETVAVYRQRVLSAFQEVEDQLAAGRLLTSQLEAEAASLVAARRTLELATNRYQAGLVTYLEVAIAQGTALARERTVVQLTAQRLVATAGLVRALGGSWKPESSLASQH